MQTRVAIFASVAILVGTLTTTGRAAAACESVVGPGIAPPPITSVGVDGFHAAWFGQSGYMTLCPGAESIATVAYLNTGTRGWVLGRATETAYLGTWNPSPGQDRPSVLGGDGANGSPNTGWPRYNRLAVQPAGYVGPGQVAWFQFNVRAPGSPGRYSVHLRPLIEGATWMEDYGVFWNVTVVGPGGAGAATSPLVSRGVPAYGSRVVTAAANVNDATYASMFRCVSPCVAALDLSGVSVPRRQSVLLTWYNVDNGYLHTLIGDAAYSLPSSYTIDAHPGPGTVLPTSGWVTLADVSGDHSNARSFALNLSGYNWVRMNVTGVDSSNGDGNAGFNLDVMDTSAVGNDGWFFAGDSITSDDMTQDETYQGTQPASASFMEQIATGSPGYFPVQIDGGIGGVTATFIAGTYTLSGSPTSSGHDYLKDWLAIFPGRYVTLNYGTNDAAGEPTSDFYQAMSILVQDVLNSGKRPIVPTIPWSCSRDVGPYNAQIQALYSAYPQVVPGPDLYAFFAANRNQISADCIHPTYPTGANLYRQQWAQWANAHIYASAPR